jgi:poly(ADP-ribose) glycohydrolase ARH3
MSIPMANSLEDRCVGSLLGVACGDILGSAVEGWPAQRIRSQYGEVRDFGTSSACAGCYTDDTQMTLALAASLAECGRMDAAHVSAKYAEYFEAWRGYGGTACGVMRALQDGADYRATARVAFPQGSFGNGGAMRIAPVGLVYRNAPDDVLYRAVVDALLCTHVHPEAVDGAFVQAKAVALLAIQPDPRRLDRQWLLREVYKGARSAVLQEKLEWLAEGMAHDASDAEVIARVGNGIRASQAVPAAFWAFLRFGDTPEECIIRAVGFGGDADTIAAMAGALVGALHGTSWIPARWYDNIENGVHGRDEIVCVARRLATLRLSLA